MGAEERQCASTLLYKAQALLSCSTLIHVLSFIYSHSSPLIHLQSHVTYLRRGGEHGSSANAHACMLHATGMLALTTDKPLASNSAPIHAFQFWAQVAPSPANSRQSHENSRQSLYLFPSWDVPSLDLSDTSF